MRLPSPGFLLSLSLYLSLHVSLSLSLVHFLCFEKKEMMQERAGLPLVEEYGVDVNPGSLTRFKITKKVKVVPDYPDSKIGFRSLLK